MYEYQKQTQEKIPIDCDIISLLVIGRLREFGIAARLVTGARDSEHIGLSPHGRVEYRDSTKKERITINPVEWLEK